MANPNLLDPLVRKSIIDEIKGQENIQRKRDSLKAYEIYNDKAMPYVREALTSQLSTSTVEQMQVVSNLNIAKAIVNKEANIYTDCPERDYEDIQEKDEEVLENVYKDSGFDSLLGKSNKYYKLNNQSFIQVVPKDSKIQLRVLHGHNIDVIPDNDDPEQAFAYIVSSFDKAYWLKTNSDGVNQTIADSDDYKKTLERYQVWTNEMVFTMNGKGEITSEIIPNAIEMLPFVDIAKDKDFEFFVRIGQALTDFTVDFNVAWSDQMFTTRMQGYSIGVLSGDANLKPDTLTLGANKIIFLPSNPSNPDSKLELDFKNPNPNTEASLKTIDSLISTFLTTRGLDTKAISSNNSGNASYSSALERLLAMLDQFRASKEDFDLYHVVELKLHKIVTKYLSLLSGTNVLEPKYWTTQAVQSSTLKLKFKEPQMIETVSEKLANEQARIDMGISDKVIALSQIDGISEDEAEERILEIEERKIESMRLMIEQNPQEVPESNVNGITEVQS
jgi:hypothetical protein